MKITIPSKKLLKAAKVASTGAMTKKAQDEDRKKLKPTDSCIRISANKDNVMFESSSQTMSVRHTVPVEDDTIVEINGNICTDAKGYLKLLDSLEGNYSIRIASEENKKDDKESSIGIVQPNGIIRTIAIQDNIEKRKGFNDTYPVAEFIAVDYNHNKVLFSIHAKALQVSVGKIKFATDPNDSSGVSDNIAIFVDNKIYFAGTDGKRCAIYAVDEMNAIIEKDNQKILINAELLKKACQCFENDIIEVIDYEDQEHIIFSSGDTKVRLHMASEEVKQQYPNISGLLKLDFPTTIVADKKDLLSAVKLLGSYNPEKSVFYFENGKSEIRLEAANRANEPVKAMVECDKISTKTTNPFALSNAFVKDFLTKIKGDKVQIFINADTKKSKMVSVNDDNFIYFMQCMSLPQAPTNT